MKKRSTGTKFGLALVLWLLISLSMIFWVFGTALMMSNPPILSRTTLGIFGYMFGSGICWTITVSCAKAWIRD